MAVLLLFLLLASPSLAQIADAPPYRVGGEVTRPEKIAGSPPQYTIEARKARVQGVVILEAIIDEQGDVTNVNVLKGLPEGLDQAAVDAVKTWKFKPATFEGRPVKVYYTLTVNFTMDKKDENEEDDGIAALFEKFLEENPELATLFQSQRLPEALAALEARPATPEVRAARCAVLMGLHRFDDALAEARADDGPDRARLLHFVAQITLRLTSHPRLTGEEREEILDTGIQAATEALAARADYRQAMITKIGLLRKKADMAVDPQRAALLYEAAELEKKANAAQ
jgi:TonB family protein